MNLLNLLRLRRVFSSMAILVLLLSSVMPMLSWATTARAGADSSWIEICSAQGSRWVQMDARGHVKAQTAQAPVAASATMHSGLCDDCLTHAAFHAAPPALAWAMPRPAPSLAAAWAVACPPAGAIRTWTSPAVRAPPDLP